LNKAFRYLVISTLVILFASTAYAALGAPADLNTWDVNIVKHANKGEDFNVSIASIATSDVNSDYNYVIGLRYTSGSTDTYMDLNAKVDADTQKGSFSATLNDANIETMNLSGSGPCNGAGDVNVIVLNKDLNTFNLQVQIPTTATDPRIDAFVGREVTVELWRLESTGASDLGFGTATCTAVDANSEFIIGPAIIVKTPNDNSKISRANNKRIAKEDQNITVIGFGFATSGIGIDNNVTISFVDANGTRMDAASKVNDDLNIYNATHLGVRQYHRNTVGDTNDRLKSMVDAVNVYGWTVDGNAITVYPDANGEFDININVPYVSAGTIGRADLNTLRATSATNGDVNAYNFVIMPNITTPGDVNVTVTISGVPYAINTAIVRNLITNIEAVSDVIVKAGSLLGSVDSDYEGIREIMVKYNDDLNFARGPTRNYGTDMNGQNGLINISTTNMPEFSADANIYMYDINSATATMPQLLKDGLMCPTTTCTNLDGTALSPSWTDDSTSKTTWTYNPVGASDGNLFFKVSAFSDYRVSNLAVEVLTPNTEEKWRYRSGGQDHNQVISFRYTDQNALDVNGLRAKIYFSSKGGGTDHIIIDDQNIHDGTGIDCNSGTGLYDINFTHWQTCTFDWNTSDFNTVVGEFVIDVNLMTPLQLDWAIDYSDANFFANPPLIEITDLNFASANFTIDDLKNATKYSSAALDINYVVDFNIFLADTNMDSNLSDYNLTFYFTTAQYDTSTGQLYAPGNGINIDLNLMPTGSNEYRSHGVACHKPTVAVNDYNCTLQWDTNSIIEGKGYLTASIVNKSIGTKYVQTQTGTGTAPLDANQLWDTNSAAYNFTVNDGNVPRTTINAGTQETPTTSSTYTIVVTCDDNTSGVETYTYRTSDGTWATSSSNRYTFSRSGDAPTSATYEAGCIDHAGNTSDINVSTTIQFDRVGPATETPSQDSPGGALPTTPSTVTPGTEITVTTEVTGIPDETTVQTTLEDAGYTPAEVEAAKVVAANTSVTQAVSVEKTTTETGSVSYNTGITVKVKNNSDKKWTDVKVVVEIPKNVASSATKVTSGFAMRVLKEDPIIEFTIPEINVGQTVDLVYNVTKSITEETANAIPLGIVAAYVESEPCEGVVCPVEVCKIGECNPGTEMCEYTNKADGTACEGSKECRGGICVAKAAPVAPPEEPAPMDYTLLIILAVIVILAAGGYYYYTRYYKKGK